MTLCHLVCVPPSNGVWGRKYILSIADHYLSSTFHFVKVCFQIKVQIWRKKWSMNYKIWMQKVVSGLSRQVVSQYIKIMYCLLWGSEGGLLIIRKAEGITVYQQMQIKKKIKIKKKKRLTISFSTQMYTVGWFYLYRKKAKLKLLTASAN